MYIRMECGLLLLQSIETDVMERDWQNGMALLGFHLQLALETVSYLLVYGCQLVRSTLSLAIA